MERQPAGERVARLLTGPWAGAAVIGALVWHAATKAPGERGEMLWVCHVAATVLAVGFFTGRHRLVATGFLMHVSWGTPGYLLEVLAARATTPTSVLVHALPITCGALAVRARGWPRGLVLPAWAFFYLWVPIAYVATAPALNVNLSHAPWPPLAAVLPGLGATWLFNGAASLLAFFAGDRVLRRWQSRRAERPVETPRPPAGPTGGDPLPAIGATALLFFAVHCAGHVRRGDLGDLLWLSNVATLALAAGCAGRRAPLVALSLSWLALDALLWTVDVAIARSPVDSAVLTHLGSFGLAVLAARVLGVPPRTWVGASVGLALLVALSRLLTAPARNVNLAFTVAPGWEARFGSHGVYLALLFALAAAQFFAVERLAARAGARVPAAAPR